MISPTTGFRSRRLKMKTLFLGALLLGVTATPAAAQNFQSTLTLDTFVAQFTGRPIGQMGGARAAVDSRLKLAACAAPQFEWHNEFKEAVVVRCMAPEWKIFVPVLAPPRPKPVAATPAPAAAASTTACCSFGERNRDSTSTRTGHAPNRSLNVVKCCCASTVVGTSTATCVPSITALNAARSATSVLP